MARESLPLVLVRLERKSVIKRRLYSTDCIQQRGYLEYGTEITEHRSIEQYVLSPPMA